MSSQVFYIRTSWLGICNIFMSFFTTPPKVQGGVCYKDNMMWGWSLHPGPGKYAPESPGSLALVFSFLRGLNTASEKYKQWNILLLVRSELLFNGAVTLHLLI